MPVNSNITANDNLVVKVQRGGGGSRVWKRSGGGGNWNRHGRGDWGGHGGNWNRHRGNHNGGHNNWWVPGLAGAGIGLGIGLLNNAPYYNQPVYRAAPVVSGGSAHVAWCEQRYRSYDVQSNTFQPYDGPRRECNSPYM